VAIAPEESTALRVRLKGRLQIDAFTFNRRSGQMPSDTFFLKRARIEALGMMGPVIGFYLAGDFAAAVPTGGLTPHTFLSTTDDYIFLRPFGNLAILQIGQYDAPLTFENRTSDIALDFMERSLTVRAFAIPANKELGAMVHGITDNQLFYYALGLFNGGGINMRNVDADLDLIGRIFFTPLALTDLPYLHEASVGISGRHGERNPLLGLPLANQTTQGNFVFLNSAFAGRGLFEANNLTVVAAELHLPVTHSGGVRAEFVRKDQGLSAASVGATQLTLLSSGELSGNSFYVEAWYWILGDDTILDIAGRELPPLVLRITNDTPRHGLMIVARCETLSETITLQQPVAGAPVGFTSVDSYEVGLNYWYAKNFRLTANYAVNHMTGTSQAEGNAIAANGGSTWEQEWLFRIAFAY